MSTCGSGINKSVIPSDIGHSNSAGRLGPLPWVLTASLILRDPGQAMENKSPFDKTGGLVSHELKVEMGLRSGTWEAPK